MRIRNLLPFIVSGGRTAMDLLVRPNRHRSLAYAEGPALRSLCDLSFSESEARYANGWGAHQKQNWGWRIDLRAGPNGKPCLLACSGGQNSDVEWIVYRLEAGFQTDEWCGASRWTATLQDALSHFALSTEPVSAEAFKCPARHPELQN